MVCQVTPEVWDITLHTYLRMTLPVPRAPVSHHVDTWLQQHGWEKQCAPGDWKIVIYDQKCDKSDQITIKLISTTYLSVYFHQTPIASSRALWC